MPPAYSSQQRNCIAEFTGVTQSDKSTAAKVLKQHNWNTQIAINSYFNNPTGAPNPFRPTLSKIFDQYRENPKDSPDEIGIEGTSRLLGELEIDLEDVGALVFSEIVQSPSLGNITRDGFVDGWSEAGVDSLPRMRSLVLQRRAQLPTDREVFKNVYQHAFVLGLQEKQKALPLDMVQVFWPLLFSPPSFDWRTATTPWFDWWMEFYTERVKKAVNRDLWKQTLTFAEQTLKDDSLGFWSEDSSWPSVIDEFVEWVRQEKRPVGGNGGANGSGEAMEIS